MMKIINTLLNYYKRRKQHANDNSLKHCIDVTNHMLKKSKYCFLVSQGKNSWSSARLVQPIIKRNSDGQFTIWLGTLKDLRKTGEIWANPKVTRVHCQAYIGGFSRFVSIHG